MVIVTPTFNSNGQCEEAIQLYQKAFNAKVDFLLRYSDADPRDFDDPLTEEQKNYVYHAEIYIGEQRVMFSDIIGSDHLMKSTSLFLTVTLDSAEEVKKAYEIMKNGSTTIYPLQSTTYSSCFVSFVDKFGFRWGIMTEQTER
ncbi:VOC family protein [Enterococcus sp. BWR-S5]|uniref:VOC family protein n=1 Tax=Enterococcus sp. BWR-S5 TaxID=2787714 RepID=UPI0019247632|nr:glyoxalase/bleomycin resistance/extradiol dioxygenase family protein [Enterococcus sp. BWR-S5]MBL1225048.1 glyoxalase/bleomycin resistance/extradiol dioxygenase family protein [Enterococcus sp. BWR-S5]